MEDVVRDKQGRLVKVVSKNEDGETLVVYDLVKMKVDNRTVPEEDRWSPMSEEVREQLCLLYGEDEGAQTVNEQVAEAIEVLSKTDLPSDVSAALVGLGSAVKAMMEANPTVGESKMPLTRGNGNG